MDRSLRGQRVRHLHARAHARTLFRATYTERKGVVPSLTCRRLEGKRTIAGAERTRQLRSMMFFLGFWNSLTPLRPLPSHFHYHLVHSAFHFLLYPIHLANSFFPQFPLSGSITLYFYPEKFIINFILLKNIYIYILLFIVNIIKVTFKFSILLSKIEEEFHSRCILK